MTSEKDHFHADWAVMSSEDADELAGDLVGVSSARLLAHGVPREERRQALRLLGVLASVADRDLVVRRPLDELATEFDLPAREAEGLLAHLVAIGAVRREAARLVVLGQEPAPLGTLRLHDFLDVIPDADARPSTPRSTVRSLRPIDTAPATESPTAVPPGPTPVFDTAPVFDTRIAGPDPCPAE